MMLWVSDAYAARYPAVLQRLRARQNNVFTLDLLFNAFLSLAGVSAPVNQPQYDFTSPEYMLTWQNALTLKTDNQRLQTDLYIPEEPRPLADDPYYLRKKNLEEAGKRFPKEKFIALHADALGAAFEAADAGFGGLEINVTAPGLQMGHGPEHVYPMTLAEYLEKSPQEKFQKIWLDVKLLDENNARETLNRLNALDKKYRLKERVVVETPLRSDSLKEFAQDGWKTSLYLFHNEPAKSDILQNAELARQYARQTANAIKTQQNAAVSFSQEVYPFVKQYLEPLLAPSVSYHTWMPDSLPPVTDRTWTDAVKQSAVIKDPRVQTVMIMPQSKFAISL